MSWDLGQGGPIKSVDDLELCSTQAGIAHGYKTLVVVEDEEGNLLNIIDVKFNLPTRSVHLVVQQEE